MEKIRAMPHSNGETWLYPHDGNFSSKNIDFFDTELLRYSSMISRTPAQNLMYSYTHVIFLGLKTFKGPNNVE